MLRLPLLLVGQIDIGSRNLTTVRTLASLGATDVNTHSILVVCTQVGLYCHCTVCSVRRVWQIVPDRVRMEARRVVLIQTRIESEGMPRVSPEHWRLPVRCGIGIDIAAGMLLL